MHVVIGGASGFLGSALVKHFRQAKLLDGPVRLTMVGRRPPSSSSTLDFKTWDEIAAKGLPEGVHAVINVAGQNMIDPRFAWSSAYERKCFSSRFGTAACLAGAIASSAQPPNTFIQISGVGGYPTADRPEPYTDEDQLGEGYWPDFIRKWEASAALPVSCPTRLVLIRTSPVLGQGGVLAKMLPLYRMCLGGPLGSGKQPFPWIHMTDFTSLFEHILVSPSLKGPIIAASPTTPTNMEFARTLSTILRRPSVFPTPAFVLKPVYGRAAELLLEGSSVSPKKVLESKFSYRFPNLDGALENIVVSTP